MMFQRVVVKRCVSRKFSSCGVLAAKTSLALFNFSKSLPNTKSSPQSLIVDAYKRQVFYEYKFLQKISPKGSLPGTYTQLPDDSQFIEQHYRELKLFNRYLSGKYHKTFSDYDSEQLLSLLYEFINEELDNSKVILDKHTPRDMVPVITVDNIFIEVRDNKIPIKRFLRLLVDVKITLNLNNNHTFILDTLLQNKEIFDEIDQKIVNKERRKN